MSAKKIDFDKINSNLNKLVKNLPVQVGNVALNHTKDSFRKQGFTDEKLDPWKARKTQNRSDRKSRKQRAILVDSGALRRSLRVRKAVFEEIAIGSYGIPYAKRHNQGLSKMPKRQFVGHSAVLNKKIQALAMKEFQKCFDV